MKIRIKQAGAVVATAIALVSASGVAISSAQSNPPATPPATQSAAPNGTQTTPNNRPQRVNLGAVLACSTTNYDDVAAKALGIDSPALRKALVGGQTLAQLATTNKVTIDAVNTALKTAYEADLAQAVTSGLITQAEADQVTTALNAAPTAMQNAAPSTSATPDATQAATPGATPLTAPNDQNPQNPQDDGGPRGNGGPFGFGPGGLPMRFLIQVPRTNTVKTYQVAATAIGVACPDLVKAVEGGQSLAQVATSKNVTAQTVIDALVAAEKAALAQDVSEGLIGQAQADAQTSQLATRIANLVNNTRQRGPGGPDGFGGGMPFGGGFPPGFGGRTPGQGNPFQPQNGQPNGQNGGQPPAAATTAAINQ